MLCHKLLSRGKCWSHQERCSGSCPTLLLLFLHAKMAETWQTLPADVSPAPLSCQEEFFLSSFSCSLQGPTLFVLGVAAADHFREIQGIAAFITLLGASVQPCALQGSCVSTGVWSVLPVTSGRKLQSFQCRSVLCHMEQAQVLSAYLEICC